MASLIGQLKVTLGLETAAFESGATRAARQSEQLGDRVENLGRNIGTLGKVLAATAIAVVGSGLIGALKDLTMASLNSAKDFKKFAELAGAGVEEFQQAAYAAKSVGIESEKLADIYKDVNDKIGDFLATRGGELKDFFDKIAPQVGVTAEQFKKLSGPEALQLYVSSLEKAGVSQKEMTFYMEAIADDASTLIPLLRNNGEEYKRLAAGARELGIVLSEEQIRNAGETAKKIELLQTVLSAKIAAVVAENAKEIGELADALLKLFTAAAKATSEWLKFRRAQGQVSTEVARANAYLDKRTDLNSATREAAKAQARRIIEERNGLESTSSSYLGGIFTIRNTREKANYAGGGLPGRSDFQNAINAGIRSMGDGDLYTNRTREFWISAESDIVDKLENIREETDKTTDAAETMGVTFEEAAQGVVYALDRMAGAFRGGSFLDKLSAVIGMAVQLGSIGLFGSKVQANLNKPIPARANGGPMLAGRMHLVGERGPELFVPDRSGTMIPNNALGMGGGPTIVNNIKGNLMTPEFWAMIEAGNQRAAEAGARGGEARILYRGRRRVGA